MMDLMLRIFHELNWLIQIGLFIYFVLLNASYFRMLSSAWKQMNKRHRLLNLRSAMGRFYQEDIPVTLIAPAYNEEAVIVDSVRSMLALNYPEYEVVVVCDGPKDGTLDRLKESFDLVPCSTMCRSRIETQPIEAVFMSKFDARLKVVLKKNGGKADALNVGINFSRYPLFCAVDTDSLIEPDALYKLAQPFISDHGTVAAGGTIRLTNGSEFENGRLKKQGIPDNWPALFQMVEYLRAFIIGRQGLDEYNAMLIISGAFGMFNKEAVVEVGGYRAKSLGEDMEMIVRLHRYMQETGRPYRITQVPEAVCWTEAPESMKMLKSQRIRWHRGLHESLMLHRSLFINDEMFSRKRLPVTLSMYFFLFFEFVAPLVETFGYVYLVCALIFGWIDWGVFAAMLMLAVTVSLFVTSGAIFLDERYTGGYATNLRGLGKIMLAAVLEPFTFRLASLKWRVMGLWHICINKQTKWEAIERKGFNRPQSISL